MTTTTMTMTKQNFISFTCTACRMMLVFVVVTMVLLQQVAAAPSSLSLSSRKQDSFNAANENDSLLQHWFFLGSKLRQEAVGAARLYRQDHDKPNETSVSPLNTLLDQGNPLASTKDSSFTSKIAVQGQFSAAPQSDATTATSNNDGVQNALGPGQDPSPLSRIEGDGQRHYYFPTIDFQRGVYMQTSLDLNTVLSVGQNEFNIYNYSMNIGTEAPGFFQWSPTEYLMYVSSVNAAGNQNMFALFNDGQDLLNGWKEVGRVSYAEGNALKNYDAQPFTHPNGKRYLLWSALFSVYITELTGYNTLGPRSQETLVYASPNTSFIVEAPGVAIHGDTVNIYWSENGYFTPQYNVQSFAVRATADPLDRSTWSSQKKQLVLQSNDESGVYGPGSAATFDGPDGTSWIAYTCFYNPNGFNQTTENPRRVQAQPLKFSSSGALMEITPEKPSRFVNY